MSLIRLFLTSWALSDALETNASLQSVLYIPNLLSYIMQKSSSRDISLSHSKLALVGRLLTNEVKESTVDVVSQVGSLQRATLLLKCQP